jgi:hypothetical protein
MATMRYHAPTPTWARTPVDGREPSDDGYR